MTKKNKLIKYFILLSILPLPINIFINVIGKLLFPTDDYGSLALAIPYYVIIVLVVQPYLSFLYSRKLVSDEKNRFALSLLPPLALILFRFIFYAISGALLAYSLILLISFGWYWTWSLIGARGKATASEDESIETEDEWTETEDESTETEDEWTETEDEWTETEDESTETEE